MREGRGRKKREGWMKCKMSKLKKKKKKEEEEEEEEEDDDDDDNDEEEEKVEAESCNPNTPELDKETTALKITSCSTRIVDAIFFDLFFFSEVPGRTGMVPKAHARIRRGWIDR